MFDQTKLYLKHLAVDTPLEPPLKHVQYLLDRRRRRKAGPGLAQLAEEDRLIDQVIGRALKSGAHCMDVGSHLGSMIGMLRRQVGKDGQITAVEPDPQKAAWLRKKFPEVTVHQFALSDRVGETTFYVNSKRRGFSGLRRHGSDADYVELKMPLQTIDAVYPADQPLDLIKIDIEGAELAALRGGIETIRRTRPLIVFECTRTGMDTFDYDSDTMWAFFRDDLGYDVFFLEDFLADRPPMDQQAFRDAHEFPWRAYNYVGVPEILDRGRGWPRAAEAA